MNRIDTARLVLRPFRWDDLESFHRLAYADPEVAPWWTGRTKALDEVRGSFARKVEQVPGEPGWLAITLEDGGALIGGMGLQRWLPEEDTSWFIPEDPQDAPKRDPQVIEVELAYVLGREHWGRGYATEAGRAVLAYGFGELGVQKVLSPISSENARSIALAQRLGCRIRRNLRPHPGRYRDTPYVYAVMDRGDGPDPPEGRALSRDAGAGRAAAAGQARRRLIRPDSPFGAFGAHGELGEQRVATYVLVHGAWHGGWCWRRVKPLLRAAGHEVYTPTLTGLGERAHLLSPDVGLDTHAQDVAGVLEYEDLRDVVLVGHSYGGLAITAAAELVAARLAQLVYLDAFAPRDGESLLDFLPPEARERTLARARAEGEGWYLPPQRGEHPYGITDPADVAWVRGKFTAHPLKTMEQPVRCADAAASSLPRTYINCTATRYFPRFAERARSEPGWRYRELDAVHDAMVTAPRALADLLIEIASAVS